MALQSAVEGLGNDHIKKELPKLQKLAMKICTFLLLLCM